MHASLAVDKDVLIFTRQTGHTLDLPGAAQWKMITRSQPGENACWVCDRQVYSLIFWNEIIGAAQAVSISIKDRNYIIKKIREFSRFDDPPTEDNVQAEMAAGSGINPPYQSN